MIDNYKIVFKDILNNYIEEKNISLKENEKNVIIERLIFKNDYLFEVINDILYYEVERIKEGKQCF